MIDLHLHLDGSLTPEDIILLADIQGTQLPTRDVEKLKDYLAFHGQDRTLTHYLTYFDLPISVMQTKESVSKAVELLVSRLARSGMIYAEIRFAPLLHTKGGLSVEEVIESAVQGLMKGLGDGKFVAQLILCCMRNVATPEQNEATVRATRKYLGKGVCALDLAGDENGFVYDKYADIFDLAKELKVPCTIHAGERGGVEQVEAAIKLGAKRIGHGVHIADSRELIDKVAHMNIGVEMCPTSNYQTGAIENMKDYPIKRYLEEGIAVCVNTDSTVVSSTSIEKEFEFLKKELGFTIEDKVKCLLNSIKLAFLPDSFKDVLRTRLLGALARQAEK